MNQTLSLIIGTFIIVFLNFSCNKVYESDKFIPPKIINTQLKPTSKKSLFLEQYLNISEPIIIGKFKFGDLIDVNPDIRFEDTTYHKDFIANKIELDVEDDFDYNGVDLSTDYSKNIFYKNPYIQNEKLDSTYYCYYPIYFVNSTKSNKLFPIGPHLSGIQEVKEKRISYYAIELNDMTFCSVGSGGIIIRPEEYIMILMKKYAGERDYATRVRFKIGTNLYISKPFWSKIHSNQFQIEEGSSLHQHYNHNENWFFSFHFDFGAIIQKQRITE
jgi:hypothetical protein